MLRIGAMNMLLHGVDDPNIEYKDSLSEMNTDKEKYSLILANPPFKGSLDYDGVSADLLKSCENKEDRIVISCAIPSYHEDWRKSSSYCTRWSIIRKQPCT
jgi:Type I restriction-modification system methyltransferase subunit